MSQRFDVFDGLVVQHRRTLFALYGWSKPDGMRGGPYFTIAYSLTEALSELTTNERVADEGSYVVTDAFLELGPIAERDPIVHVKLVPVREIGQVE